MSMSRKDYELISEALNFAKNVVNDSGLYDPESAIGLASNIIADAIERNYPNFRPTQFLEAAGVQK